MYRDETSNESIDVHANESIDVQGAFCICCVSLVVSGDKMCPHWERTGRFNATCSGQPVSRTI